METVDRRTLLAGAGLLGAAALVRTARSGPLDPPDGPVSPTYKTLDQVEPRTPVQSLPGSGTALHVISEPGSYYLAGNIQGVAGKNGIEIAADNVTLDLCGFTLQGSQACPDAVRVTGGAHTRRHVVVRNGFIRLWGGRGVDANAVDNGRLENLHLDRVGEGGQFAYGTLEIGGDSVIADCVVAHSHGSVATYERGIIARCLLHDNDPGGYFMVRDGLIIDSSCIGSNGNGFTIQEGGMIVRCVARFINGVGFQGNSGATVLDCTASNCSEAGVRALGSGNVRIERCNLSFSGRGIWVDGASYCHIEANSAKECGVGFQIDAPRNLLARNVATNNGTAFSIVGGNTHGPVVSVVGAGDVSGVPGADHPWANLIY